MKTPIRVAGLVIAAAASVGLAGTAFAHGKPGGHVNKTTVTKKCDVSAVCGDGNHSLNGNLDGNGNGNTLNILSGNLNGNSLLSGNNINLPVTIAPDFCGSPIALLSGAQKGLCVGNYHPVNAGQNVGGDSPGQNSPGQDSPGQSSPGQGTGSDAGQPVPDAPAPHPHTGDAAVTG